MLVATIVMAGFRVRAGDAVPSELRYRVNMKHESRRGVPAHPGQSKAADSLRILPQAASRFLRVLFLFLTLKRLTFASEHLVYG